MAQIKPNKKVQTDHFLRWQNTNREKKKIMNITPWVMPEYHMISNLLVISVKYLMGMAIKNKTKAESASNQLIKRKNFMLTPQKPASIRRV